MLGERWPLFGGSGRGMAVCWMSVGPCSGAPVGSEIGPGYSSHHLHSSQGTASVLTRAPAEVPQFIMTFGG